MLAKYHQPSPYSWLWFSKDNPTGHNERGKKEADRRGSGKTISKSGWTLPVPIGQLKTGQDGEGLLRIHLWCPFQGYGNRIE